MSVEFGDEDDGTQYHSIYDDFYWYTHFVDTDFAYGRALSQTAGTAIMRLADADFIPVDYSPQAEAIAKYEADLEKLLKDKQDEFKERNLELQEGVFKATIDPRRPLLPPPAETDAAVHQFCAHEKRGRALKKSAERYSAALAACAAAGSPALPATARRAHSTRICCGSHALFLNQKGLPERPWFKNQIYAPGCVYGVWRQAHRGGARVHGREALAGCGGAGAAGRAGDRERRGRGRQGRAADPGGGSGARLH